MALNESHFRKHKGQGPYDYMNFNVSEWNGVCVCVYECVCGCGAWITQQGADIGTYKQCGVADRRNYW